MSYYRRRNSYFDTNYDQSTPVAQYLRERQKVNVLIFGVEPDLDPNPKSCKYCSEVLILVNDGLNLLSQGCGIRTPLTTTTTSNDNSKESKSKLKQKDSLENKSFIITQSDDQRRDRQRSRLEETETEEDLGALNFISRLYGNVGDY